MRSGGGFVKEGHVLQIANKKIEARCGKHHVFSMREGVEVGRKEKIVPVQFQKVCGI